MRPRSFNNLHAAQRWSDYGGVAYLYQDPDVKPMLLSQHEAGWMYFWAGKAGLTFVQTRDRGNAFQRLDVPEECAERMMSVSPPGPVISDRAWSSPTVMYFTGTRHGLTWDQLDSLREWVFARTITVANHGLCVGADHQFHDLLVKARCGRPQPMIRGWRASVPGHLTVHGLVTCDEEIEPRPPLARNDAMVTHCVAQLDQRWETVWVACPDSDTVIQRGGTWYTVRAARQAGQRVFIIFPDGRVQCPA